MDPALQEAIRLELDQDEIIEAIIRLKDIMSIPPGIQIISQFGEIITCRVRRRDVRGIYEKPEIISFKASRLVSDGFFEEEHPDLSDSLTIDFSEISKYAEATDEVTGKGVIIGIIDWGADFAHIDFINPDGSSRFLALWDQNGRLAGKSPKPFGYGSAFDRHEINAALKTKAPYAALGYHPGKGNPTGGSHGTHVMGIAAGNGRSGVKGVAPEADIIFVHLGSSKVKESVKLGDSVKFLEAIDFIRIKAGNRPLVINASVGRHGGSHDGKSLVEMAMDQFLENRNNTAICQSTGNYFQTNTHSSGLVHPGRSEEVVFITDKADLTPNELEVWYQPKDIFGVEVQHLESNLSVSCGIDEKSDLLVNNKLIGRIYHRSNEPNNGLNNVDLFLYPSAPFGEWKVRLHGEKIVDGRFHVWIERDGGCASCQSRFKSNYVDPLTTTGSICNGLNTIAVGAFDKTKNVLGNFSSSGPTIDGRIKPNILAPGVNIWAASSSPVSKTNGGQKLTRMSGTSMATPHVTGTIALILGIVKSSIDIHSLRKLIIGSTSPLEVSINDHYRSGSGMLDINKAIESVREFNLSLAIVDQSLISEELSDMFQADSEIYDEVFPFEKISETQPGEGSFVDFDEDDEFIFDTDDDRDDTEFCSCHSYHGDYEGSVTDPEDWSECAG